MVWNAEMDNCLLLGLQHQIYRGLKIGNGFKDVAYNAIAAKVSSKFNITISKYNVMNRLKTLKREYHLVYGLQQKSGFVGIKRQRDLKSAMMYGYHMLRYHPPI